MKKYTRTRTEKPALVRVKKNGYVVGISSWTLSRQ